MNPLTIIESNADIKKNKNHFDAIMNKYKNGILPKRVTFFREKDDLGFNFYRFTGVFELDVKESIKNTKTVWRRCNDEFRI